ncbi:MAG: ion transporter [Hyphomicrobiales bacterium]|nr:ion transporter [Hyphomicrobiales bacterium]
MTEKKIIYLKDIDAQTLLEDDDAVVNIPKGLPFRKFMYSWLLDPNIKGNYQKTIDNSIALLILLNLLALLFERVPRIYEPYHLWFHYFDIFSVIVFTVEYVLRFYLAVEDSEFKGSRFPRFAYVRSPFALIDLIAIAPFYLQSFIAIDLRVLRLLRLLRIFKLFRVIIPAYKQFVELNAGRTFRQRLHALVFPSRYGGDLQQYFDIFISFFVITSVLISILESVQIIDYVMNVEFSVFDSVAVAIFTVEYTVRLYSCVEEKRFSGAIAGRFKQATTPSTVIDLLAILPFFLEVFLHHLIDLRFLRVFRLTRLLKLTRNSDATAILIKVIAREWPILSASAFIMMLLVIMTASFGYLFEHEAQPDKFDNIPNSIYWAVITLASVGYGDISPVTTMGRLVTVVMALMGIGIFAIPAALLASAFSDELRKEREQLRNNLYKMLKDGKLDESEAKVLREEARRLHLTIEEVNHLIETVVKEQEERDSREGMTVNAIAKDTVMSIEHYKYLLGQIRQLAQLTDVKQFESEAERQGLLSEAERNVWAAVKGR